MEKVSSRFWEKVDKTDTCWNWTAYCENGYGEFNIEGKIMKAHRVSYILANGSITEGKVIRHKCDNPKCVNPAHLEEGTQQENICDMYNRQRRKPINIHKTNTGHHHISKDKARGRFKVSIKGIQKRFKTLDEALTFRNEHLS